MVKLMKQIKNLYDPVSICYSVFWDVSVVLTMV
jgi:hypothetical protein